MPIKKITNYDSRCYCTTDVFTKLSTYSIALNKPISDIYPSEFNVHLILILNHNTILYSLQNVFIKETENTENSLFFLSEHFPQYFRGFSIHGIATHVSQS
jgi:hypothetical protein